MFLLSTFVLAPIACGSSGIPAPPYAPQPTSALAEVPYPPPPARVERVPASPRRNATWVDGEWTWRGRRWLWVRGRWVVPPAGARFSPWAMVRAKDGTLWEARGAWRDARGAAIDAPAPLAEADPSEAAVVDSFGDLHAPGRSLRPPGARNGAGESKGAKR